VDLGSSLWTSNCTHRQSGPVSARNGDNPFFPCAQAPARHMTQRSRTLGCTRRWRLPSVPNPSSSCASSLPLAIICSISRQSRYSRRKSRTGYASPPVPAQANVVLAILAWCVAPPCTLAPPCGRPCIISGQQQQRQPLTGQAAPCSPPGPPATRPSTEILGLAKPAARSPLMTPATRQAAAMQRCWLPRRTCWALQNERVTSPAVAAAGLHSAAPRASLNRPFPGNCLASYPKLSATTAVWHQQTCSCAQGPLPA